MDEHSAQSTYREKLIEHLFIGELLKISWCSRTFSLEVARPEVDRAGYDVILEANGCTRHVQLKAVHAAAKTSRQNVHVHLANKQSGCVVVVLFKEDNLALGPYLFFGGRPGEPLPGMDRFKNARHTRGNARGVKAERPNLRQIPHRAFTRVETVEELYGLLFGNHEQNTPKPSAD